MARVPEPVSEAVTIKPGSRILAEALAELLDVTIGTWVIEIRLKDGFAERVFRHEQLSADDLSRFDDPEAKDLGLAAQDFVARRRARRTD